MSNIGDDYEVTNLSTNNLLKSHWNHNLLNDYMNGFSCDNIKEVENTIEVLSQDLNPVSQANIDSLSLKLNNLFINPAKKLEMCKTITDEKLKPPRRFQSKPWFNKECEKKRKDYMNAFNKIRKADGVVERQKSVLNFEKEAGIYKKFIRKCKRTYNAGIHSRLRTLKNHNPKDYWSILNKCNSSSTKSTVPLNTFMSHFEKLSQGSPEQVGNFDPCSQAHSVNMDINQPFTLDEVQNIVKKLKNNKSSGIDNIINEFLKYCPVAVLKLVVEMFNLIFLSGVVLTEWCIGIIQPIYKNKGSIYDPDNYRGITLLSCMGKLFTACVNARLRFIWIVLAF
ncbi:hypothetical protein HOLleu_01775 [Holothuria leucospilota]|uniref:Uncharacterized protein n=1 Tax=Holothuria leucospilota TaxID=206669 RepID=A0A9Q1CQW3_HOLLE|nr:hypothetical protein HOLleu_01775 [Holothuria leucospilota]